MYNNPRNQWQNQDQAPQGSEFLDQEVSFEQRETAPNGISNETMGEQALNSVEGSMAGNLDNKQELPIVADSVPADNNGEKLEKKVDFSDNKEFTASDKKIIKKIIDESSVDDPASYYEKMRNMNWEYLQRKFNRKIGEQE